MSIIWDFYQHYENKDNENKDVACEQYINEMSQTHMDYTCIVSGLIINSNYPHLGASADSLRWQSSDNARPQTATRTYYIT